MKQDISNPFLRIPANIIDNELKQELLECFLEYCIYEGSYQHLISRIISIKYFDE